eukprot:scaffold121285_cov31-Tisochrysis_lutea.AAC.2
MTIQSWQHQQIACASKSLTPGAAHHKIVAHSTSRRPLVTPYPLGGAQAGIGRRGTKANFAA